MVTDRKRPLPDWEKATVYAKGIESGLLLKAKEWLHAYAGDYERAFDLAHDCSVDLDQYENGEIPAWILELAERAFVSTRTSLDRLTVEVLFDHEACQPDFKAILAEVGEDLQKNRAKIADLEVLSGKTNHAQWFIRIYT